MRETWPGQVQYLRLFLNTAIKHSAHCAGCDSLHGQINFSNQHR